jgi:hypothetical protein
MNNIEFRSRVCYVWRRKFIPNVLLFRDDWFHHNFLYSWTELIILYFLRRNWFNLYHPRIEILNLSVLSGLQPYFNSKVIVHCPRIENFKSLLLQVWWPCTTMGNNTDIENSATLSQVDYMVWSHNNVLHDQWSLAFQDIVSVLEDPKIWTLIHA